MMFRVQVKVISGKASRKGKTHEFAIEDENERSARAFLGNTQKHLYLVDIKAG